MPPPHPNISPSVCHGVVIVCCSIAAQKCVLKFLPSRMALGHASSLLSLLLCHNNKLSRLDACPSATREGKNFNTHFWAAYGCRDFMVVETLRRQTANDVFDFTTLL